LHALGEYCKQDVRTERAMVKVLRRLTPRERDIYLLDQRVNDRGVAIDRPLILAAQEIVERAVLAADDRIFAITKGEVESITQAGRMREWMHVDSIAKPALKEMLADENLDSDQREVLQLRSDVGRTSVAKLQAMLDYAMADDRMRGMLLYHAAGTGRWGGKGPQPQNFPRGGEITELDLEAAINAIIALDYDTVAKMGPAVVVVMEVLRSMLVAPDGFELMAADFSAIEARVLNWLAGQDDMVALFRKYDEASAEDKPKYDPYRNNAARIYNIPLDEVKKFPHRHTGKFQELGCGFQMGAKKAVSAAKDVYGIEITPEQAEEIVADYRASHDKVVQFWADANLAVIAATDNPGMPIRFGDMGRLTAIVAGAYLYIGLPSGRPLVYASPRVVNHEVKIPASYGPEGELREAAHSFWTRAVQFMGVNSQTKQWGKQTLYGGLIVENIVQAVSRDLLAEGMLRGEAKGYIPILSVHDEVVAEVPEGFGDVKEFEKLLAELPEWGAGCPVSAEGWRGKRYRK
jgi:DNA polymerase